MTGREKQRTANHSVQLRGMIWKTCTVCYHKGRERKRRRGWERAKEEREGGRAEEIEVDGIQGRQH